MNKIDRRKNRRRAPLTTSAVVVATLFAATGIAACQENAAARTAFEAAHGSQHEHFKHPQLARGVLSVRGTEASEQITLRLRADERETLEVDVDNDGSADFDFKRRKIATIAVDAGSGDDLVRIDETNGTFTDVIPTALDAGAGNDTIAGGVGVETLFGGDGNDVIDGNRGNDVAFMGAGDDVFVWDPGDGSDIVEGENGADTMLFNGAAVAEQVDASPNGSRLRFFRNPGGVTMDTDDVERVDFNALGGSDDVTINDLSATDVDTMNLDLGVSGVGDGQADRIVVNGTNGDDTIDVSGDANSLKVNGLTLTQLLHAEVANDRLDVNTLAGTDTVASGGLTAGAIQLFVDGVFVP